MNNIDEMLHRMRHDELHEWSDWDAAADLIESQQHRVTELEAEADTWQKAALTLEAERDALQDAAMGADGSQSSCSAASKRLEWVPIYSDTDEARAIRWASEMHASVYPRPFLRILDRLDGTVIGAWQHHGYEQEDTK